MRARRLAVFPHIDVGSHHVPVIIDVITEFARDVVSIFGDNAIAAGRSRESRFTGRDGRFANNMFAFVKVSFLFADMDDDLG